MIFAENHWRRHRDISKGNFGKFLENFRARAEDRSITPFSKTEAALLDRVGRKGGKTLLVKSGQHGPKSAGQEATTTKLGRGLRLAKVRAPQLWLSKPAVLTCAGGQKRCESIEVGLEDRDLSSRKAANQVESLASFAGGGDRKVCLKSQEPRHLGASSRTRVNGDICQVRELQRSDLEDRDLSSKEAANQVERLAIFAGGGESGGFGLKSQVQASGGRELQFRKSKDCVKSKS